MIIKVQNKRNAIGWIAVGLSTLITSVWSFWGIIENFHEGWYLESLWMNIGLMFIQYLSPMLLLLVVTLISIRWGKIGAGWVAAILGTSERKIK